MVENKFLNKLYDLQKETAVGLAEHPATDHAQYMKRVGFYEGLQKAAEILHELLNVDDED